MPSPTRMLRSTLRTERMPGMTVETAGSCPLPWRIRLPERDDAALPCGLLQRSRKDPLFAAALDAARRL